MQFGRHGATAVTVPDPERWRRWFSLLLSVLVIAGIAGAASYVGKAGLRDAEHQRLAERTKFVEQDAKFSDYAYGPGTLSSTVAHAPFSKTDRSFDRSLLDEFRKRGVRPKNLPRTCADAGTVTSHWYRATPAARSWRLRLGYQPYCICRFVFSILRLRSCRCYWASLA